MGSSGIVGEATATADRDWASVAVDTFAIAIAGLSAESSHATTGVNVLSLAVSKSIEIVLTVRVGHKEVIASAVVVVVTMSWVTAVDSLALNAADTWVWKHAMSVTDFSALASASAVVMTVSSSSTSVASSRVMSGFSVDMAVAFAGHANSSEKSSNSELHFFRNYSNLNLANLNVLFILVQSVRKHELTVIDLTEFSLNSY